MLARFDHYTAAAKTLVDPLAAIPIRANAINLIRAKQGTKLFNRLLGAKWRTYFAHSVEHGSHSFLVCDCQREAVRCTTRWVTERAVQEAPVVWPLTNTRIDARLDALARDKAFDVGAELGAIFCRSPNGVFLVFLVD